VHTLRFGTTVVTALLAIAIWSATASADVELGAPGQLRPVPSQPEGNPNVPGTEDTAATGLFECSVAYATVANIPGGFAIGNCAQGKLLYRTRKSDYVGTPPAGYFDGGYVDDAFDGCGWIFEGYNRKTAERNNAGCASPSRGESEFIAYKNCPSPCTDGSPVLNPGECHLYANYRPWSANGVQAGFIRSIPTNATISDGTPRLAWRYVTRYPSADGWSGHWVMVRDRQHSAGQGNWGFVPRFCLGV